MHTLAQLRSGELAGVKRLDLRCGLTEFPREIFDLADTLEVLNLTGNRLRELPEDIGRLHRLRILFASENQFDHLPPVLGDCSRLAMVGFKANRIRGVDPAALPRTLSWLILTDNRLTVLPEALGERTGLRKLMLSGNLLSTLPESLARCDQLELLRIAANGFRALPPWLFEMPRLAWLAFAGNPVSALARPQPAVMPAIPWGELEMETMLGEGASGTIHRAVWRGGERVAVKVFKGAVTSDGLPDCEMEASLAAGSHPHLIPVHGRLTGHPEEAEGLVLDLVDPAFRVLAGPPSLETCTRDVYPEDFRIDAKAAWKVALSVASAALHLHRCGINHGDLYAHNVLWHPDGRAYLGDFGAAAFYPPELAAALQRLEARAFGCLLEELRRHVGEETSLAPEAAVLNELAQRCLATRPGERPGFEEIVTILAGME